tara:strand:+ start:778 stop:1326 length:549 start_codon:yes stop_codon:yes gene_type:complete
MSSSVANALLILTSVNIEDGDNEACGTPKLYKVHADDLSKLPEMQKQLQELARVSEEGYHGVQFLECFTLIPATFETDGSLSQTTLLTLSAINMALRADKLFDDDRWIESELGNSTPISVRDLRAFVLESIEKAETTKRGMLTLNFDTIETFLSTAAHKQVAGSKRLPENAEDERTNKKVAA